MTRQPEQRFEIIPRTRFVFLRMAAEEAAVRQFLLAVFFLQQYGLHQAAAGSRPIARMDIDVPAVQAPRAMIGVSVSSRIVSALAAPEILRTPLKHFS